MEKTPPLRRVDHHARNLDELVPMPQVDFRKLDSNVVYLWFFGRVIFWCFMSLLALGAWLTGLAQSRATALMLGIGIGGPLALAHLLWPFISYRYWGYALRDHDLLIRSGVIWKRMSAIPFSRIQHVDSGAGPMERTLGIANLIIHTAGANMGSLSIPGLYSEDAEALRDYLSEVGHTHANI